MCKTEHFNGLTEGEQERLVILMEECNEVGSIIGKILRHGYESTNPDGDTSITNRVLLTKELGDVMQAIDMLSLKNNDIIYSDIINYKEVKENRPNKYLHHQPIN